MSKIKFRGYNRVKFQSEKLGKTVFCQSLLLRDYLIHLEWDENVLSYELKPFKISYKLGDVRKTLSPHLLIKTFDNQQIVAWLKSSTEDEQSLNQAVKLISNICENEGFIFAVKSPDEIRRPPFLSNLKLLRRYHRCEITLAQTLLCSEFFLTVSNPTLGDLIKFFIHKNENAGTAIALLSKKIVEADIDSLSLDDSLPIKLRRQFPIFKQGRLQI
jgi:hypothetical protein